MSGVIYFLTKSVKFNFLVNKKIETFRSSEFHQNAFESEKIIFKEFLVQVILLNRIFITVRLRFEKFISLKIFLLGFKNMQQSLSKCMYITEQII